MSGEVRDILQAALLGQPFTVKQFGAAPWVLAGTVSVANFPAVQPVSGTVSVANFPSVQPVLVTNFPAAAPSVVAASYRHLFANGTTTCKTGAGVLRLVVVNTPGSMPNTLTLFDGAAAIAVVKGGGSAVALAYNLPFSTGLVAVSTSGAAADATVTFD